MTSKEKRLFFKSDWCFRAIVRVYGYSTREISLLPREYKSFRQTSKTMRYLQTHLAHQAKTQRQKTQADSFLVTEPNTPEAAHDSSREKKCSPFPKRHCSAVYQGNAIFDWRTSPVPPFPRPIRPHRRRLVLQVQAQGVGYVSPGGEASSQPQSVFS